MAANNKCTNSPLGNSTMNNNDINNDVYINFREGNNTIYICPMKDYFKNKYKSNDDSNNNDNSNNNDDSNNNEDSNNEDSTNNNNTEERHPFNKVEPICPEHKSTSELNKKEYFHSWKKSIHTLKNNSDKNSSDDNNIDINSNERRSKYSHSFNINKEENYFKKFCVNPERKQKKIPYTDMNFSTAIKKIYKRRYQMIFNKKLFYLFQKCEELFNKGIWLFKIFNNTLNEKKIFKIINMILESEEKEILIKPKYEKYFYNFIKNVSLNDNKNMYDKKLNNASKFQRLNKTISARNFHRTIKSKHNKNIINNAYHPNFGTSLKSKKNETTLLSSQPNQEYNMLNKDKLSLLLHSNNKKQTIQECIIDYVDYNFHSQMYNSPTRMYCSVNQLDTTVSFIKTPSFL